MMLVSIIDDDLSVRRALRRLVAKARTIAAGGRPIVIFPEGTRVAPGVHLPYQPGVAALVLALQSEPPPSAAATPKPAKASATETSSPDDKLQSQATRKARRGCHDEGGSVS